MSKILGKIQGGYEKYKLMSITQQIEFIIFKCVRWLLLPSYAYLVVTLFKVTYHLWAEGNLTNDDLMHTLHAVDIVMIANVVKMIITGSYNSFVSKDHGYENEQISSGVLKLKISTSILGVASIHMLQAYISIETVAMDTIWKMAILFTLFAASSVVFAYVDYLHSKTGSHDEPKDDPDTPLIGPRESHKH